MVLYSNLTEVKVNDQDYTPRPVLKLTSTNIKGKITTSNSEEDIKKFVSSNGLSEGNSSTIKSLFLEAQTNNFSVIIEGV